MGISAISKNENFPFCLIALSGDQFVGSVLGIEADLNERPALTPWVAALWVEPQARRQGIAKALISEALARIFGQTHSVAYLCAKTDKRHYYERAGWQLIEQNVGPNGLDVFKLCAKQ
ncbi:MAG: GNAT family N-acetyltransferase [Aestuariivirga sp.]